ncbi:MAG: glycosyltransferase family 4 protein [Anaerolineae bacterium]
MKPIKVALILVAPTPYRRPMVDRLLQCEEINLQVYYCYGTHIDRPWASEAEKYERTVIFSDRPFRGRLPVHIRPHIHFNPDIVSELRRQAFEVVVVPGYSPLTTVAAIAWCQWTRTPYVMICESHKGKPQSKAVKWLKRLVLSPLIKPASAWLVPGSYHREYLTSYGANPERIFTSPLSPDVEFFQRESAKSKDLVSELRREMGLHESKVICYVGRLVAVKGVDLLLKAFLRVRSAAPDTALLVVGDGPLRGQLEGMCQAGGSGGVYFVGFKQPAELPRYYALSDLFVLPSKAETWGVVVNEAMACGLPVVVSDSVGAAGDIVRDGYNGFVVKTGDVIELSAAMLKLVENEQLRAEMGRRSLEIIRGWDYPLGVDGFLKAARLASGRQLGSELKVNSFR